MNRRVEGHGLGVDFAPVARALFARGVAVSLREAATQPHLRVGSDMILWQGTDDPHARARAIEDGAEDVVGPWMHEAEAVARILRRTGDRALRLAVGDLVIDLIDRSVERAGQAIALLDREYRLLLYLAQRPGQAIGRAELRAAIWGLSFDPGTNSVEVHMSRLRAKVDRGFGRPMLHTVRQGGAGCGYMLATGPSRA